MVNQTFFFFSFSLFNYPSNLLPICLLRAMKLSFPTFSEEVAK